MISSITFREGAQVRDPRIPIAIGRNTNELLERLEIEREARRYFQKTEERSPSSKTYSQPLTTSQVIIKERIELTELLNHLNNWTFKTGTFAFLNKPHEKIEISSNTNGNDQVNLLIHLTGIKLPDNNEDLPLITVTNIESGKKYKLNLSLRKDFKSYAKLIPDEPIPRGEYRIEVKEKPNYNEFKGLFDKPEVRVRGKNIDVASFLNEELPPPFYEITLGKTSYFLSEPFLHASRTAFVLYLQGVETVYVRGTYKSLSHCCPWRIATHTVDGWLGKGHSETDVALPIEIQSGIESILEKKEWKVKAQFDFGRIPQSLSSVCPTASLIPRQTHGVNIGSFKDSADPSSFQFSHEGLSPDMNRGEVEHFKSKTPLYGEVISYVFESKDRTVLHLLNLALNENNEPVGWYGDIQFPISNTNLDTFGLKLSIPSVPRLLFTPAHEHVSMVEENKILLPFKGKKDLHMSGYADISTFTNKLPPIRNFLNYIKRKANHKP